MKIWIPIRKEYGPISQAKELIHTTVGVKQPDVYDRCSYRSDGGGMRIDSWKIICLAFADRLWLVLEKSRGDVSLVEQDIIDYFSTADFDPPPKQKKNCNFLVWTVSYFRKIFCPQKVTYNESKIFFQYSQLAPNQFKSQFMLHKSTISKNQYW
jgi:hypothetical protein